MSMRLGFETLFPLDLELFSCLINRRYKSYSLKNNGQISCHSSYTEYSLLGPFLEEKQMKMFVNFAEIF